MNEKENIFSGKFYFIICFYVFNKVILNFRDPFSSNPRFNDGFIKKTVKRYFERSFIAAADYVITVNEYCANLMRFQELATK